MTKLPFEDDEKVEKQVSKVKLDASKSRFSSKNEEKKPNDKSLHDRVVEFKEHEKEVAQEIMQLSKTYIGFIKNKVVKENKSPIEEDLEKETVQKLIQISMELNNDDTQPEGIGSLGLINLLFRSVLAQRDIINKLEYRVVLLERKLSSPEKTK